MSKTNINVTQLSINIKHKMSEDGIEREMHSELYNQDKTKKILIAKNTPSSDPDCKKSLNQIAKEDAQKGDKPYPKIPT